METLPLDQELELFLANLDLPSCETHQKLQTDFICLDCNCIYYKTPLCSLCFTKLHNKKHVKFEIRNLLCFLLQNQAQILSKCDILKSLPFYDGISNKIRLIEKNIAYLEKLKENMIEMKVHINKRLEKYLPNAKNLKEIIQNQSKEKNSFNNLMNILLNTIENQQELSLKKAEFSDIDLKSFKILIEDPFFPNFSPDLPQTDVQISENSNKISTNCFKFDEINKGDGILISNEKTAKREEYSKKDQRFCLISPKIHKTCQITFKITNMANWIGVGLVRYNFVKSHLKFLYTNEIHERGHYMISQNGYSWSDSDDNEHQLARAFLFVTGDLIDVLYDKEKKTLEFQNRSTKKKKILEVQEREDELVFAVALFGPDDTVEIVDEGGDSGK